MVDRMSEFMRDHLSDLRTKPVSQSANTRQSRHTPPCQSSEDDEQIAKDELPNDSPCKRDIPEVVLRIGRLPHVAVLDGQDGDDGADDLEALSVVPPLFVM